MRRSLGTATQMSSLRTAGRRWRGRHYGSAVRVRWTRSCSRELSSQYHGLCALLGASDCGSFVSFSGAGDSPGVTAEAVIGTGPFLALRLTFALPSSCYATMARSCAPSYDMRGAPRAGSNSSRVEQSVVTAPLPSFFPAQLIRELLKTSTSKEFHSALTAEAAATAAAAGAAPAAAEGGAEVASA